MSVFYVYVRNGDRRAFPLGPFADKATADEWVDPLREHGEQVDDWAWAYEYGVAKLPRAPRAGHLNEHLGYEPPEGLLTRAAT